VFIQAVNEKRRKLQKQAGKSENGFLGYHVGPELIIAVYIDDLLIIGKTREIIKQFKQRLATRIPIKGSDDNNDARDYLNIRVSRNRDKGTLRLLQKAYI
jgi:hypothetical protein